MNTYSTNNVPDYYEYKDLKSFINSFQISKLKLVSHKKVKYYNIPCSFDIETSSYYRYQGQIYDVNQIIELREKLGNKFKEDEAVKHAFMYIWMLSINDVRIVGRRWDEFIDTINAIKKKFNLSSKKRLIIYDHNLSYEFQFIQHLFEWTNVFAREPRKIIYCEDEEIVFKCSYFLSNTSLEVIGNNLTKYKAQKQVGSLDYSKIRNDKTPMTHEEINYCLYDVIVLSNYIREKIEEEKNICKIPLTNTGYVRRYCKRYCNTKFNRLAMYKVLSKMQMSERLYSHLKRAFQGGYTHSNPINTNVLITDTYSYDFTSSYPSVLCLEEYPISKPFQIKVKSVKEFHAKINKYCCLFDITFYNIRLKENETNSIISQSKCFECENAIVDNGRVASADKITITLTDVDYKCIHSFYTWDKIGVGYMVVYRKGYLPKPLIECILHFYENKTKLKDVEGKEREYNTLKGMLNSTYGMMVSDIIHPEYVYDNGEWVCKVEDITKQLDKYNQSKGRFLSYEWGVWCTAYARRNLYTGIRELKHHFIYADTDSVKFRYLEQHVKYFESYNKIIDKKIERVMKKYSIEKEKFYPKTVSGKIKPLGYWDYDGHNDFKTLGAKRYLTYDLEKLKYKMTVSGVNKKTAMPYLEDKAKQLGESVFELFNDEMYIPPYKTGKLLHTYIDIEQRDDVIDYLGNHSKMIERSAIHLEPTSYSMSLASQYLDYINHIKLKYTRDI